MKTFRLERVQDLGISINEAWDFFKNPENLKEITPKHLGFDIVSKNLPDEIYTDLIIEYRVKPILGIPLKWITRISDVKKPEGFVDEQLNGPYKLWHHQHTFRPIEGGIQMRDVVTYALPLGFLGRLFHPIVVRPQLESIFNFRYEVLEKRFPIKED